MSTVLSPDRTLAVAHTRLTRMRVVVGVVGAVTAAGAFTLVGLAGTADLTGVWDAPHLAAATIVGPLTVLASLWLSRAWDNLAHAKRMLALAREDAAAGERAFADDARLAGQLHRLACDLFASEVDETLIEAPDFAALEPSAPTLLMPRVGTRRAGVEVSGA